jgi:hypothetical protein
MEHSVKLSKLPEGAVFPERLRERIAFDAGQERLVYKGFMTKCTYDELSALTDDPDYHRALEQLFVLTSEEVSPRAARHRVPVAMVMATVGAVALVLVVLWSVTRRFSADTRGGTAPQNAVSAASR